MSLRTSERVRHKKSLEESSKEINVEERHFLVAFQGGEICSVPRGKVLELNVVVDQECTVMWHTGKKYKAKVLFIGTQNEVHEKENRICSSDDEMPNQSDQKVDSNSVKEQEQTSGIQKEVCNEENQICCSDDEMPNWNDQKIDGISRKAQEQISGIQKEVYKEENQICCSDDEMPNQSDQKIGGNSIKAQEQISGTQKEVLEEVNLICSNDYDEKDKSECPVQEKEKMKIRKRKLVSLPKKKSHVSQKTTQSSVDSKKSAGGGKQKKKVTQSLCGSKIGTSSEKRKKKANVMSKSKNSKSTKDDKFSIEIGSPVSSDDESSEGETLINPGSVMSTNKIALDPTTTTTENSNVMMEINTLKLGLKELSDTLKSLLNNPSLLSSRVNIPKPLCPAGHFHTPSSYTGYQQWVPNGYQELLPHLPPPPPTYCPLPVLDNQPAAVSPIQSSCSDRQSSSDSLTHRSSISLEDSDNEEVPPLPPPLPLPMVYPEEHTQKESYFDKKEEIRLPLKPCQSKETSSQSVPNKKRRKKVKDNVIYPITEVFNSVFLSDCLTESVSRPNFSLNLVTKFFTEEVRLTSNVSGKSGKNQLDRDMIAAIKVASFRMWPLKSSENESAAWRDCVKAIDEGGRRLRRNMATSKQPEVNTKEN